MKVNYTEGTWFAVPLKKGNFAVGLVARATRKGPIVLAYMFGPKRATVPSLEELSSLSCDSALKVLRAGDLHLINGKWPVIGTSKSFERSSWPFPEFKRIEPIANREWIERYSEDDPGVLVAEREVPLGSSSLERNFLSGAGAVELKMSKLLEEP